MANKEEKETRYYIDLNLGTKEILNWNCVQREDLLQELETP